MIRALVLCTFLLVTSAQASTVITLGTRVEGRLASATAIEVLTFEGLAGETVTLSVGALRSKLKPRLELWDTSTDTRLAAADAAKRKVGLKQVSLPTTGTYELRLMALDGTTGRWSLKTRARPDKGLLKPAADTGTGQPGSVRVSFVAQPGTLLGAVVRPAKGSAALPGAPLLSGPQGPVDVTAQTKAKGTRTIIAKQPLPAFGAYTLDVDNVGGDGELQIVVRLKRGKLPKQILVTDALAGALFVTPDVVYADDASTMMTARVALGEIPYPVGEVRLVARDEQGATDATAMLDDGELAGHGDEIAGDRVYTSVMNLTVQPQDAGLRTYQAVVELKGPRVGRSAEVAVLVANRLTDEEIDDILAIQTASQALIDQALVDGDLDVVLTDLEAQLAADPSVAEVGRSEGGRGLWVRYASGVAGVLSSWEDGTKGGSRAAGRGAVPLAAPADGRLVDYPAYDGLLTLDGPDLGTPASSGGQILAAAGGAGSLPAGSNKVLALAAQYFDWGDDDDVPDMATKLIENGCFDVTYKKSTSKGSGSVEDFKRLGDYGVVLISSHGDSFFATLSQPWKAVFGWEGAFSGQVCLHSNMSATTANVRTYESDLRKGRLILWYGSYGITPAFITHYSGRMPDSLVYMSICRGTFNDSMARAFTSQGAAAFLGYSDYVAVSFCKAHGGPLLDTLLQDDKTLADAYAYDIETDDDPAEYLLTGDDRLCLDPSRLHDGSFESGNLTAAWTTAGDARILTGLGGVLPTDGARMAIVSTGLGFTVTSGSLVQTVCLPENATGILFDWNFLSAEWLWWCGSIFQDTFEVELTRVDDPGNPVVVFRRTIDELCEQVSMTPTLFDKTPGTPPFEDGQQAGEVYTSGWISSLVDVPAGMAGERVAISFRCFDVGDSEWDSAVLLDQIEVLTLDP